MPLPVSLTTRMALVCAFLNCDSRDQLLPIWRASPGPFTVYRRQIILKGESARLSHDGLPVRPSKKTNPTLIRSCLGARKAGAQRAVLPGSDYQILFRIGTKWFNSFL
jgi:hypothetical protein